MIFIHFKVFLPKFELLDKVLKQTSKTAIITYYQFILKHVNNCNQDIQKIKIILFHNI